MNITGLKILVVVSVLLLGSCAEAILLLHPHSKKLVPAQSITHNFMNECATQLGQNIEADSYSRCSNLMVCISDKSGKTDLNSYKSLSTFEKIKPPGSHIAVPITEMQANAQKAGPKAIAMVNQISDIRTQCLVSTGLDQEYQ